MWKHPQKTGVRKSRNDRVEAATREQESGSMVHAGGAAFGSQIRGLRPQFWALSLQFRCFQTRGRGDTTGTESGAPSPQTTGPQLGHRRDGKRDNSRAASGTPMDQAGTPRRDATGTMKGGRRKPPPRITNAASQTRQARHEHQIWTDSTKFGVSSTRAGQTKCCRFVKNIETRPATRSTATALLWINTQIAPILKRRI